MKEMYTTKLIMDSSQNGISHRIKKCKNAPDAEALVRRIFPMEVHTVRIYNEDSPGYSVSPACGVALREYINFCCHCGKKLSWRDFCHGKVKEECTQLKKKG